MISMEYLGPVRPVVVRRVLETFPDHEVTVVVTARDLNRSIPAMWQETVQNGRTWTFAEYLAGIEAWRPGHRDESARGAGVGTDLLAPAEHRPLRAHVGRRRSAPSRVVVVTVPPPGAPRELLWERFCSVLGTSPDGFAPARMGNESVGAASTLVIRRVNELLNDEGLVFPEGTDLRKGVLAKQVLAARKGEEPAIGLPVAPWVADHAAHMVSALQELGVALVVTWSDLDAGGRAGGGPGVRASARWWPTRRSPGWPGCWPSRSGSRPPSPGRADSTVDDEGSG